MIEDPEEQAREALRAHQAAAGIRFEDPAAPVTPPRTGEFDRDEEF
jgi:hypothetical protein